MSRILQCLRSLSIFMLSSREESFSPFTLLRPAKILGATGEILVGGCKSGVQRPTSKLSDILRSDLHKAILLSAATQDLPRSVICNVHGVNPKFLQIGIAKREQVEKGNKAFGKSAYYIGKMERNKGYRAP